VIDVGAGPPLIIVPGIQGRWEWMAPAIDELSSRQRVLTFSLSEDGGPSSRTDGRIPEHDMSNDFWEKCIDDLFRRRNIGQAALVGVSFGGLIAARYAARHPQRIRGLVLVSAPSPRWPLDARNEAYLERPLQSAPIFVARSALRLMPEVLSARPTWAGRVGFLSRHLGRVVRFPASPRKMALWAKAWQALDVAADCRRIVTPTLVITGESNLDRVVPQASTLDYLALIPGARHVMLEGTGHLGLVTRPGEFARLVGEFVATCT
jgi:3-oxoadipate enol-lactonase